MRAARLAAFIALGAAIIPGIGFGLGAAFHLGPQFLTAPTSLLVCVALYVVGGWGLGRDIALESASCARGAAPASSSRRRSTRSCWRCARTSIRTSSSTP